MGRLISRDPVLPGNDPYLYVRNNPETFTDIDGLDGGGGCGCRPNPSPPPSSSTSGSMSPSSPAAVFSTGWYGWALSLDEQVTFHLVTDIWWGAEFYDILAIFAELVGWLPVAILLLITAQSWFLGGWTIYEIDSIGGFQGVYFAETWAGGLWVWHNPVPWGF